MSLAHEEFIQYLGSHLKPNVYIELGVDEGKTFGLIAPYVARAIAVDLKIPENVEEHEHYEMSTDDFFKQGWFQEEADLIFIDADHSHAAAKKDLKNALEILSDDGVIVMHDTDPVSNFMADNPKACGDVYKIVDEIEEGKFPDINVVTLPIGDAGLSIITKKKCTRTQRRALALPESINEDGALKPKFYVPPSYASISEFEEMQEQSPYKEYPTKG